MALINNIYVHVVDEQLSRDSNITQHPVEEGLPLTDSARSNPKTVSISGEIVDTDQYKAETAINKIEKLRTGCSLITYKGRNTVGNFMIKSFNTTHPNTVWGGAEFDMELVEVRIAKSPYSGKGASGSASSSPKLEVGAIVVFTGGPVYVSSDATKAAANRGRSTCKITIINNRSWSLHDYHLISTDGGRVYGWVDESNIEATGTMGTSGVSNGGTQQVKDKTPALKNPLHPIHEELN